MSLDQAGFGAADSPGAAAEHDVSDLQSQLAQLQAENQQLRQQQQAAPAPAPASPPAPAGASDDVIAQLQRQVDLLSRALGASGGAIAEQKQLRGPEGVAFGQFEKFGEQWMVVVQPQSGRPPQRVKVDDEQGLGDLFALYPELKQLTVPEEAKQQGFKEPAAS